MLELLQIAGVVGWVIGSLVNFQIADEKNRWAGGCLFLSLVISPVPVWCYLVAVPPSDARASAGARAAPDRATGTD